MQISAVFLTGSKHKVIWCSYTIWMILVPNITTFGAPIFPALFEDPNFKHTHLRKHRWIQTLLKFSSSYLNSADINTQLTSKYLPTNKHSAIRMILVYFYLVAFMPLNVFILCHDLPAVYKEGKAFFYSTINWNMYHRSNINSNGRGNKATEKHQHQTLLEESKKDLRERKSPSLLLPLSMDWKKAVFELHAALLWHRNSKMPQNPSIFICILLYTNTPNQIYTS